MFLKPKNWNDFQHYKHRSPPWIKLHKNLLDDFEFQCLHVASRALAPMLWLLASESEDGAFDATPEKLAFRLRMTPKELTDALKPLIQKGFFIVVQDASAVLAECYQDATTETETEKSKSTEYREEAEKICTNPSDSRAEQPMVANTAKLKPPAKKASAEPSKTAAVWQAYCQAYHDRYGVDPVRNAKVNAQLAQLVTRVGEVEAPAVAAFYVTHNNAFYVRSKHAVGLLLQDCEGLRTEWATGTQVTQTQAMLGDKTQNNVSVFDKISNDFEKYGRMLTFSEVMERKRDPERFNRDFFNLKDTIDV